MGNRFGLSDVRRVHPRSIAGIAWVDLLAGTAPHLQRDDGAGAAELLLRQIEQAVRADDLVCPVGTSAVAVQFATVASAVPLEVLGDRLARAVGRRQGFGRTAPGAAVAVGMAAPLDGEAASPVTSRARSAARSAPRALLRHGRSGPLAGGAAVTVGGALIFVPSRKCSVMSI